MQGKKDSNEDPIKYWISAGSEITGGVAGGGAGFAIGTLAGGPAGALIGGALGPIVSKILVKVLTDFCDRSLSKSEKSRVGACVAFTLAKIEENIETSHKLRDDGFFENGIDERSKAEEILEGILIKSRDEYEQKKIKIIANIYANIAFASEFSVNQSNCLIKLIERLTYIQICLLALLYKQKTIEMGDILYYGWLDKESIKNGLRYESQTILQQIYEMNSLGLVGWTKPDRKNRDEKIKLYLDELGKRYCKLMSLEDVPDEDIDCVKEVIDKAIPHLPVCRIIQSRSM